ncbi:NfeD family protein [Halomonas stenophila]|uniref:Membrane protein implicated in regulation of membrane protease activity n=1 Tax=Halomonas stenophila TaxID=795312 RepID=A0A7W5EXJ2_9GAMM|nr:NfeD family protein [Halomonas stenophila]MBB3232546.1 membrane protein implicated in regulation of membrane protease activity [Halomonas stenophila]
MRFLPNIVPFVVVLGVAAALVLSEVPALQMGGVILLPAFLLISYAADWFAAWSNERHVEQRPDLLRNDAIGERVRARGRFEIRDGMATGLVTLNGEQWKAYCPDHVPEDGELLTVQRREGLTLYVQSQGRDA